MKLKFTKPTKTPPPIVGNNTQKVVGILGGGQLSQMLVEAAEKIELRTNPFCFSNDDPAAQASKEFFVGKISDEVALKEYFSKVDVVTYENDFLPYELLAKFSNVKFVPALSCLDRVRDKLAQKELLKELEIPSAEFIKFSGGDLAGWLRGVAEKFKGECVFKWTREGYDGKGVYLFTGDLIGAEGFCKAAVSRGLEVFAERKILFKRELAIVTAYSVKDDFAFYPLVISEQKNGICKKVMGPAVAFGVKAELEIQARDYAKKIAIHLKLYGAFAIEFFESSSGELLVNELAPRVHNSGHFSQDASGASQFENHWRAILGLDLIQDHTTKFFAMTNLLGGNGERTGEIGALNVPEGFSFHWYKKTESRPGRKMGHINLVCSTVGELQAKLKVLDALETEWLSKFSGRD